MGTWLMKGLTIYALIERVLRVSVMFTSIGKGEPRSQQKRSLTYLVVGIRPSGTYRGFGCIFQTGTSQRHSGSHNPTDREDRRSF